MDLAQLEIFCAIAEQGSVSAGAGLALIPASMLESMPGRDSVNAWPLSEGIGQIAIWLVWRKGTRSVNLLAEWYPVTGSA